MVKKFCIGRKYLKAPQKLYSIFIIKITYFKKDYKNGGEGKKFFHLRKEKVEK